MKRVAHFWNIEASCDLLKFQEPPVFLVTPVPGVHLQNEWAQGISVHETKTPTQPRLTHARLGKLRHIFLREYCPDNTKTNEELTKI